MLGEYTAKTSEGAVPVVALPEFALQGTLATQTFKFLRDELLPNLDSALSPENVRVGVHSIGECCKLIEYGTGMGRSDPLLWPLRELKRRMRGAHSHRKFRVAALPLLLGPGI
jgi:hypothetical protein